VWRETQADARHHFAQACDQVVLRVEERLAAYALILRGAAGLLSASHPVTRADWHSYVETLQPERSVPGVQGIGFAEYIPAERLAQHQARVRTEGFAQYRVWPEQPRPDYTAVVYLEPFEGRNLRAFGFDMYTEATRRAAMKRARDSGHATLSGPVQLVQETGTDVQTGVLMYLPVYRVGTDPGTPDQRQQALMGWAYSPYRMDDLMRGMLAGWEDGGGKNVDLHVDDITEGGALQRLHDGKPRPAARPPALLHEQREIDLYGRRWRLSFEDQVGSDAVDFDSAWLTLGGG
jgi:CHASE1-domain containing sensor protein